MGLTLQAGKAVKPRSCGLHKQQASQHGDIKPEHRRAKNHRPPPSIPSRRKHVKSTCVGQERLNRVGKEQTAWREGNGCLTPAGTLSSTASTWQELARQEDNDKGSQNKDTVGAVCEVAHTQTCTQSAWSGMVMLPTARHHTVRLGAAPQVHSLRGSPCVATPPKTLRPLHSVFALNQLRPENKTVITQSASPAARRRSQYCLPSGPPPSSAAVGA